MCQAVLGDDDGEEDDIAVDADIHLSSTDILARIEAAVQTLVEQVVSNSEPTLQMVSRNNSNTFYQVAAAGPNQPAASQPVEQDETQMEADGQEEQLATGSDRVLAVGQRIQTRTLFGLGGAGALSFARVFKVMAAVHTLVQTGRQATQRDLYYQLLKPPLFSNSRDVNQAIQDVVALLRIPRSGLGISCSSRGAVAGKLYIREGAMGAWQDCSTCGSGGRTLPGDLAALDTYSLRCSASYLLIVEKDAIFQRLVEDRIFDKVPLVLITAKGHPDLATRAFAAKLVNSFPGQLRVLGLVDYNPAGVVILRTYKFGSARMGLESQRYALPSLRWLGLRASMLEDVEADALAPLTAKDRAMLPGLRASLQQHDPAWVSELDAMEVAGFKGDIEALYSVTGYSGFGPLLARAILRHEFV